MESFETAVTSAALADPVDEQGLVIGPNCSNSPPVVLLTQACTCHFHLTSIHLVLLDPAPPSR